ncbi:hypothetical protein ABK040_010256 [Willaertia magna]
MNSKYNFLQLIKHSETLNVELKPLIEGSDEDTFSNVNIKNILKRNNELFIISEDGLIYQNDNNTTNSFQPITQLNSYYIKNIFKGFSIEIDNSNNKRNANNNSTGLFLLTGDGKILHMSIKDKLIGISQQLHLQSSKYSVDEVFPFYSNDHKIQDSISVVSLGVGKTHAVVLTQNGKVFSWGQHLFGNLGHNHMNQLEMEYSTHQSTINYCDKPFLIQTLSKFTIKQISVGDYHTLCLSEEGRIFSFGNNKFGQLGTGDSMDRYYASPITKLLRHKIEKISCGSCFSICLNETGNVFGFGKSIFLCKNTEDNTVSDPTLISSLSNYKIKHIECGSTYSVAVSDNNDLIFFGEYYNNILITNPIVLNQYFPTNQMASIISCNNNELLLKIGEQQTQDVVLERMKLLKDDIRRESIKLIERAEYLTSLIKELNNDTLNEKILTISSEYLKLFENHNHQHLLTQSDEILKTVSISKELNECENIKKVLNSLHDEIDVWNSKRLKLTTVVDLFVEKYEVFVQQVREIDDNVIGIRDSLDKIVSIESKEDENELSKSLESLKNLSKNHKNDLCSNTSPILETSFEDNLVLSDMNLGPEDDVCLQDLHSYELSESLGDDVQQDTQLDKEMIKNVLDNFKKNVEQTFFTDIQAKLFQLNEKLDDLQSKSTLLKEKIHLNVIFQILEALEIKPDQLVCKNLEVIYGEILKLKTENQNLKEKNSQKDLEKARQHIATLELENLELTQQIEELQKSFTQNNLLTSENEKLKAQLLLLKKKNQSSSVNTSLQNDFQQMKIKNEKLNNEINNKKDEVRNLEKKIDQLETQVNQVNWEKQCLLEEKNKTQQIVNHLTVRLSSAESDNLKQLEEILLMKNNISSTRDTIEFMIRDISFLFSSSGKDLLIPLSNITLRNNNQKSISTLEECLFLLKDYISLLKDSIEFLFGEREIYWNEINEQYTNNMIQLSDKQKTDDNQLRLLAKEKEDLMSNIQSLQAQINFKNSDVDRLQSQLSSLHTICETYEDTYKEMENQYQEELKKEKELQKIIQTLEEKLQEELLEKNNVIMAWKEKLENSSVQYLDLQNQHENALQQVNNLLEEKEIMMGQLAVYNTAISEKIEILLLLSKFMNEMENFNCLEKTKIEKSLEDISGLLNFEDNNTLQFEIMDSLNTSGFDKVIIASPILGNNTQFHKKENSIVLNEKDTIESELMKKKDTMNNYYLNINQIINNIKDSLKVTFEKKDNYVKELESDINTMKTVIEDCCKYLQTTIKDR